MNKYLQNRNRLTDLENELMVTKGKGGEIFSETMSGMQRACR